MYAGGDARARRHRRRVSKPYTIERGKSVSDEVDVGAPKGAKVGRKVTLRVTAGSREGDTNAADTVALKLRVVGVGDSRVSRTGARSFSGTASSGRAGAKADRAGVRLRRVEVAVRALGKGCRWLSGKNATIRTHKLAKGATCRPQGWQSATGSSPLAPVPAQVPPAAAPTRSPPARSPRTASARRRSQARRKPPQPSASPKGTVPFMF